jgi:retron-type reverse transcriptase
MLPWDKFRSKVFSLQCRIYDAMRNNDIQQVTKLQKCLINSSSTHYLAIKECTEISIGRKIPGNDQTLIKTYEEKFALADFIKHHISNWKQSPYRKVKILLYKDTPLFFSIPNMEDRIIHFIWKLALEPAHEAIFDYSSYGFRPGCNIWDMQKTILYRLKSLSKEAGKKVLTLDFSQCSKLIDHTVLINKLIFPSRYKKALYKSLKMGILDDVLVPVSYQYSATTLSFFLANVAFHGSEDLTKNITNISGGLETFRYGSYILYMFDEDEYLIYSLIEQFFYKIGIIFSHLDESTFKPLHNFEFLGWCFIIKPNGRIITYPTKAEWIRHKSDIKFLLKNTVDSTIGRLAKIERKMKKWYYYHQLCNISELRSQIYSLKHWVNRYLRLHTTMEKGKRHILLRNIFDTQFYL